MNRKARYASMRALGLAGISTLFAGLVAVFGQSAAQRQPYSTWSDFGGAMDSMQYSSLKQITKSNVSRLEQVWSYKAPGPRGRFAFSPLVVDRVMYVVGSGGAIVALDATPGNRSGRIRWTGRRRIGDSITGRARIDLTEGSFMQSIVTCRN